MMLAALALGALALAGTPYIRWNPAVLAVAHFLTLGVLASAMLGAMMQILPVATHIQVLRPRITSTIVHGCLTLGTLSLAAGFASARPVFHTTAVALLAAAFLTFLLAVAGGLLRGWPHRSPGSGEILVAVRLALVALAVTIALGLFMAGLRGGLWHIGPASAGGWMHKLPNLHALWGLAGWVGLLVMGISYQVIPIFQATEIYPKPLTSTLAPLAFLLLSVFSLAGAWLTPDTAGSAALLALPAVLLALCYLVYGVTTTRLLLTRKRPSPEPTTWFWHAGMASLMGAALLGAAHALVVDAWGMTPATFDMLLGTLLIPGFAISAVNGMLYKIVPFLLWHNAQRRAPVALPFMPKVRQFIAEGDAMRQFGAHLCAIVLLVVACAIPALLLPAAIALATSAGLLAWNMGRALKLYSSTCRRITQTLAAMPPAATP